MIYLFALQLMQQSTWWCNNYSVWTNWLQFSPFSIFFFLFSFPFCFYFLFHFLFWINWTPWLLLSTVNLGSNMKLGKIIVWVFSDIWSKLIYHKNIPSKKWNLLQKYSIIALMHWWNILQWKFTVKIFHEIKLTAKFRLQNAFCWQISTSLPSARQFQWIVESFMKRRFPEKGKRKSIIIKISTQQPIQNRVSPTRWSA